MEHREESYIALHAPNIVNVCVDNYQSGEMSGRIYHCYDQEPWSFRNVIEMVERMEDLYNRIAYPQSATKIRSFRKQDNAETPLNKVVESQQIVEHQGEMGTFLVHVKYRQNSTWQGQLTWVEGKNNQEFLSVLDFLKIINNDLGTGIQL